MGATRFNNEERERFVHNVVLGMSPIKAVAAIGVTARVKSAVSLLMADEYVLDLLQAYRDELAARAFVDREKLTLMAMDAFDVARIQADAKGMVMVVRELADMHGMHTPQELKITRVDVTGAQAIKAVRCLDDMELLRLAGPLEVNVLDAEFVVLEDKQ